MAPAGSRGRGRSGAAARMAQSEKPMATVGACIALAASMKSAKVSGVRGDIGFVDRPISQAMEEREAAVEQNAATNREDR